MTKIDPGYILYGIKNKKIVWGMPGFKSPFSVSAYIERIKAKTDVDYYVSKKMAA